MHRGPWQPATIRATMTGSVAAPKWDTWTRSEILAVRGYETSPATAAVACSSMATAHRLEAATVTTNGNPPVVTTPGAWRR
jgi:hypothetical protein